jgi:hypothetical protein
MLSQTPFFIHAWWRSGSTYVWSKLRTNQSSRCYFEPLNPSIADLTLTTVQLPPDSDDTKNFRHPRLTNHYFAEYAELIESARLNYSPELSYDRYLLQPGDSDDSLQNYLNRLISSASAVKRRPILCFCRSQLRSAWMKQTFGGIHVAQLRNPSDQWVSFKSYQLEVRPNFAVELIIIALKLRRLCPDAFVHIEEFERFAQQLTKRASLPMHTIAQYFIPQFVAQRDCLDIFLVIWIASALQALSFCDFALDIDELSINRDYRIRAEQWFASAGCHVDFSDCCSPIAAEPNAQFERAVEDAVKAIRSNASSLVLCKPDIIIKWWPALSGLTRQIIETATAQPEA